MTQLIVSSLLVTSCWFVLISPIRANQTCDTDIPISSAVFRHNPKAHSDIHYYFINGTVVMSGDAMVIPYDMSPNTSVQTFSEFFGGVQVDNPVNLVYMNGSDRMEIIAYRNATNSYAQWTYDFNTSTVSEQYVSSLVGQTITTATIAVAKIDAFNVRILDKAANGAITASTVQLSTGQQVGRKLPLLTDTASNTIDMHLTWMPVRDLKGRQITAAVSENGNLFIFYANEYYIHAEMKKHMKHDILEHRLYKVLCHYWESQSPAPDTPPSGQPSDMPPSDEPPPPPKSTDKVKPESSSKMWILYLFIVLIIIVVVVVAVMIYIGKVFAKSEDKSSAAKSESGSAKATGLESGSALSSEG